MSSPDATQLINSLSHDEALSLLKELASSNEELASLDRGRLTRDRNRRGWV